MLKNIRHRLRFVWALMLFIILSLLSSDAMCKNLGAVLQIKGPIGPATSDYIHRGLEEAHDKGASMVILRLDTPGGLDTSMREIIRDFLASPIPIITYVSPKGAHAASAGAFIVYASHLAAMAPGTTIGAASPVQLGIPMTPTEQSKEDESDKKRKPGLEDKAMSDAIAYIKTLADIQGRNKEWAVKFVAEAASLTADEAYKAGVIEIRARNIEDLLLKANGRTVNVLDHRVVLDTNDMTLVEIQPDWRSKFLEIITNPNIAFFLLLIGLYGVLFEFMNPGAIAPGVIGSICLILGLYALHVLPISYAGLALIFIGLGFIIAEAFLPSFGILGIGGIIAFVIGSIMLINTDIPGFQISLSFIIIMTLISIGFIFMAASLVLRSHRRPVVSGEGFMIGKEGIVFEWKKEEGTIKILGELWQAKSSQELKKNDRVKVTSMDGLTLHIKKIKREEIKNV